MMVIMLLTSENGLKVFWFDGQANGFFNMVEETQRGSFSEMHVFLSFARAPNKNPTEMILLKHITHRLEFFSPISRIMSSVRPLCSIHTVQKQKCLEMQVHMQSIP